MAGDNIITLTNDNFDGTIASGVTLVDFWAVWCGPCRMVAPIVDQIADENAGVVKVGKINVDEEPALAARFGIASIPTLMIFKDGQLMEKMVGARPKAELQRLLDRSK